MRYLLADLHVDGEIREDELSVYLAADGFVAAFPMSGGRFRIMAVDPRPQDEGAAPPEIGKLQEICDHVLPVPVRLHDLRWSSRFRISGRHLTSLRVGSIFFGGDAAHRGAGGRHLAAHEPAPQGHRGPEDGVALRHTAPGPSA